MRSAGPGILFLLLGFYGGKGVGYGIVDDDADDGDDRAGAGYAPCKNVRNYCSSAVVFLSDVDAGGTDDGDDDGDEENDDDDVAAEDSDPLMLGEALAGIDNSVFGKRNA